MAALSRQPTGSHARRSIPAQRPSTWRALASLGTVVAIVIATASAYTVRPGDTLYGVARQHDTTVDALVATNGIDDPNLIFVGDQLTIPGDGGKPPAADTAAAAPEPAAATRVARVGGTVPSLGPTGSPGDRREHVVQSGDTIEAIAAANDISVAQFMAANGFTNPNELVLGMRVQMAAAGPPPGTNAGGAGTHVVALGDTVHGIAKATGTTVAAIAAANDMTNPSLIFVGQRLEIPGTTGGYVCPVPGASFVNDWGIAKPDGRFHRGVDVMAPAGTTVQAPTSGSLVQVEGSRGGLQFILYGDDGYTHYGSHMASFGAAGRVAAGDAIGTVGTTGNAIGGPPHLHYSVELGVGLINPYPSLAATC